MAGPRCILAPVVVALAAGVSTALGGAAAPEGAGSAAEERTAAQARPGLRLARVAAAGDAVGVVAAPGQRNRLFLVGQGGRIRIVERGRVLARPFLDLSGRVSSGGERGLLGLAFHPGYARNGRLFVNFTDRAGDTRVMEFHRAGRNRAAPGSGRLLLRIPQPRANHNGGDMAFGPDGRLYIATGDGGDAGTAQRVGALLGKILRVDVDARTGRLPYGIPRDNPFRARPGRAEVYAYGLRNPWRISFDRARGDIWIADVGQSAVEEVNHLPRGRARGANFGWSAFEGRRPFAGRQALRGRAPTWPVAAYGRDRGCSVTGGHVYRGSRLAALRGRYVFADYCSGRVWSMRAGPRPGGVREETGRLGVSLSRVTSFGQALDGELYVLGNGSLYRFAPRAR